MMPTPGDPRTAARQAALPVRRRLRPLLLGGAMRVLPPLFGRLAWRQAQRLGSALGLLAWWLVRRDRRRTLAHLALAFPEAAPGEWRALGSACFRHHGKNLAECLHLLRADCAAVLAHVRLEGFEHLAAARASGRPLIVVSGHCGNWELVPATLNCLGVGMQVVARQLDEAPLDALLVGLRSRFGTATIARGSLGAARALLKVLRGGGVLGLVIDQDTKVDGVWVPFFGRLAYTPVGAAEIALRRSAAVLPVFIERGADGEHLLRILPPLALPAGPEAATAVMTAAIEAQVRRRPEQWVWMHRRWRRQPDGAPGAAAAGGR